MYFCPECDLYFVEPVVAGDDEEGTHYNVCPYCENTNFRSVSDEDYREER